MYNLNNSLCAANVWNYSAVSALLDLLVEPEEEHDWTSTIDGVPLNEFVYLGGKMTEAADSKADVDRRIGLATGVAGPDSNWRSKDIGLLTKTRLYKALVLSVLL